ncbi:uncharacterized protein LOC111640738 [Centruroides sculpturatus]|uniref:uncharacterized protein LOC111640738 n=1 Tax=Centruroides sculpturatus TaxID=218467 RepID=UPI000C6DAB1A|nr:uncharacterized protein LOC111640738 [Centruroides sculpturatus]
MEITTSKEQDDNASIIHYPNHKYNYNINGTIDDLIASSDVKMQSQTKWEPSNDAAQVKKTVFEVGEWLKFSDELDEKDIGETVHHLSISGPTTVKRTGHVHRGGYDKEEESGPLGTTKAPNCAQYGRYYCSYKEEYPTEIVTQVVKYMKWPLEKLFKDLRTLQMPKLAELGDGSLVCDSQTKIVRPGWAKNVNGRWLVVLNNEYYHQYVTEVQCKYDGSYCNFVPPCYHATCQQRYNKQTLLVIDPHHPYKGPFLSKFLFASCCVCYVPKHSKKNY